MKFFSLKEVTQNTILSGRFVPEANLEKRNCQFLAQQSPQFLNLWLYTHPMEANKSEKNNNVYSCLVKDPGEIMFPYEWTLPPFELDLMGITVLHWVGGLKWKFN